MGNKLDGLCYPIGTIVDNSDILYLGGNLAHTLRERYTHRIDVEDPETTIAGFIKEIYNHCVNDYEIERMYFRESYTMLTNAIEKMNQEIQLSNLRSLHIALRNATREYKMDNI